MSKRVTLGGDRLGQGQKMQVDLHGYERSNHDLGYTWRNTMSVGTLVPFMSMLALPGDKFDIKLNADVMTLPTIGPLFGSFKLQCDVFSVPIRLYNARIHNNPLNVGLDMKNIKLPLLEIDAPNVNPNWTRPLESQQVHPSCLLNYLGYNSFGHAFGVSKFKKYVNAVPYLAYFDVFKNYYSQKQEENAYIIHNTISEDIGKFSGVSYVNSLGQEDSIVISPADEQASLSTGTTFAPYSSTKQYVHLVGTNLDANAITMTADWMFVDGTPETRTGKVADYFSVLINEPNLVSLRLRYSGSAEVFNTVIFDNVTNWDKKSIVLKPFALENIDKMREAILQHTGTSPFMIGNSNVRLLPPYNFCFDKYSEAFGIDMLACSQSQEGLLVKTYQADIFNTWLKEESIVGEGSIDDLTKIDTSAGYFSIDTFNISKKLYLMMNRIVVAGNTYQDYIMATYDVETYLNSEIPHFEGGMYQEVVFQEVISNSATDEEPLGTLAGRGRNYGKQKGGTIIVDVKEPSYIIGVCSLTPRIAYSQGNNWDINLKTFDDFHKPQLDEIGFQDLLTDQFASVTTAVSALGVESFKSIGKQPCWINYMTNYDRIYGNFALKDNQMFMTLNRRYDIEYNQETEEVEVTDATTYIDPVKFNYIFAQTSLDSMNFWVSLGVDVDARRKMSAKIMPNL